MHGGPSSAKQAKANEKRAVAKAEAAVQAMEEMAVKLEQATQTLKETEEKVAALEKATQKPSVDEEDDYHYEEDDSYLCPSLLPCP